MKITDIVLGSLFSILILSIGCGPSNTEPAIDEKHIDNQIEALNHEISQSPAMPDGYLRRAEFYFDGQLYGEAISDLIKCVELDSSQVECWHLLSDSYLEDNRSRPAVESLEDFLKIDPKHVPTLLKLAELQLIIKKYTPAHFHLNTVLKLDKSNAEALFKKGLIYHYQEKTFASCRILTTSYPK